MADRTDPKTGITYVGAGKRTLTAEQKDKLIAGRKAARAQNAAQKVAARTSGELAAKVRAGKLANLIDAIVLNGGDFLMRDAALQHAAKLLRELSK